MMSRPHLLPLAACLLCSALALPAAAPAKAPAPRANAAKAKAAARSTQKRVAARPQAVSYRKAVARRPVAPSGPSAERIRLIQNALIERGYLQGEANGFWSPACVEALKRFEADQNVKVDGKIDSKMLIALGLGPRYDNALNAASLGMAFASGDSGGNDSPR